jgi:hypothetical protein
MLQIGRAATGEDQPLVGSIACLQVMAQIGVHVWRDFSLPEESFEIGIDLSAGEIPLGTCCKEQLENTTLAGKCQVGQPAFIPLRIEACQALFEKNFEDGIGQGDSNENEAAVHGHSIFSQWIKPAVEALLPALVFG